MKKKILIGFMLVLSLLFTSCYPELSVQQYDKLKDDLKNLDVKRAELEAEVESLEANIANLKVIDAETRKYVTFLEKMVSTQSSERILTGEFDVDSLVNSKTVLIGLSENLSESNVKYYVELMDSENATQTVAAYYKAIEYCLKTMKTNLNK